MPSTSYAHVHTNSNGSIRLLRTLQLCLQLCSLLFVDFRNLFGSLFCTLLVFDLHFLFVNTCFQISDLPNEASQSNQCR